MEFTTVTRVSPKKNRKRECCETGVSVIYSPIFEMRIYQKFISREDCRANPCLVYLFGDNLEQRGLGGQAKEMRGEPNAIGIPTKKSPEKYPDSYFTDAEFDANRAALDAAFHAALYAARQRHVAMIFVIPLDGLGTGLAELEKRAPKTFLYLQERLGDL